MSATGLAALFLLVTLGLGVAAAVKRSRPVAILAACSSLLFLAYTALLLLVISQM